MATLTHLLLYPIKSCAGIAVRSATVLESGLFALGVHDREWMLVTDDGQFLTQREHPRMALIRPLPDGGKLRIHAPGMDELALPLAWDEAAATRTVQIWDDKVDAADCGDAAAAWFTAALRTPCGVTEVRAVNRDALRRANPPACRNGHLDNRAPAVG